eukprot:TRINITY_DN3329_c0_g1_i2.p1 TRINITY_DN3329_c0_g1~~TRINITY_DN3329_c0_g1_i2.p1  ORF type:complete len:1003 (+),score=212.55 TRINITY_DN3329_c0_g1_i2:117-3125(+)
MNKLSIRASAEMFLRHMDENGLSPTTKEELRQRYNEFRGGGVSVRMVAPSAVIYYLISKKYVVRDGTLHLRRPIVVDQNLRPRQPTGGHHVPPAASGPAPSSTGPAPGAGPAPGSGPAPDPAPGGAGGHGQTPHTRAKALAARFRGNLSLLVLNKADVFIPEIIIPLTPIVGQILQFEIPVLNQSKNTPRDFRAVFTLERNPAITITPSASFTLNPQQMFNFNLTVRLTTPGAIHAAVVLAFHGFTIVRLLDIQVGDAGGVVRSLDPTEPFQYPRPRVVQDPDIVMPGVRPDYNNASPKWVNNLDSYDIPVGLQSAINHQDYEDPASSLYQTLNQPLTPANYHRKFTTLMHLEESQQHIDIRMYDMDNVTLTRAGTFFALRVPGLAEKRPSVLYGDRVLIRIKSGDRAEYEGYVHRVLLEEVHLLFHTSLHARGGPLHVSHVRFTVSRVTLRRCHQAVGLACPSLLPSLFPTHVPVPVPATATAGNVVGDADMYDMKIRQYFDVALNQRQRQAVSFIAGGKHNQTPYLLFGPPGTGKTRTVVESINQVLEKPGMRVLACAPSNNAADLLVERLARIRPFGTNDILRVNAIGRSVSTCPEVVKQYSTIRDNSFVIPNLDQVELSFIVVATCISAAVLYSIGCDPGTFSHIFIDEAGQAQEPEALACVAGLVGPDTRVVLAGDPRQLGPVLQSPVARQHGLELSLLERLITAASPYAKTTAPNMMQFGGYNPYVITKLVLNYRSHVNIMQIPNELFYDNELVATGHPSITNALLGWSPFPNPKVPLLFLGVRGKNQREKRSPSWFNAEEALAVRTLVDSAMQERRLKPGDIGVISPYAKQVEKIRQLLGGVPYAGLQVGSVEQFQGQERRLIIVSTVRSDPSFFEFDNKHNLGFLRNPKRFNVALTRAQAGLVVVGDPYTLKEDPNWCRFIRFANQHGSYEGTPLPAELMSGQDLNSHVDDLLQKFDNIVLDESDSDDSSDSGDSTDDDWVHVQGAFRNTTMRA